MAYEKGSYLKELEEEHGEGRHDEERDDLCPSCILLNNEDYARREGFASDEEYQKFISDQCNQPSPDLEAAIDEVSLEEHRRGKHGKYPDRNCPACVEQHGITNI